MTPEQENELFRAIGRIEGKQDLILAANAINDEKVAKLENKVNYGGGFFGTLAFAWPLVVAYVKSRLGVF